MKVVTSAKVSNKVTSENDDSMDMEEDAPGAVANKLTESGVDAAFKGTKRMATLKSQGEARTTVNLTTTTKAMDMDRNKDSDEQNVRRGAERTEEKQADHSDEEGQEEKSLSQNRPLPRGYGQNRNHAGGGLQVGRHSHPLGTKQCPKLSNPSQTKRKWLVHRGPSGS